MFNHCIVMAAGNGTRLLPLTLDTPKAMLSIDGSPLISRTLVQLKGRIRNITVTVGNKADELIQHVYHEGVQTILITAGKGNSWWLFNSLLSLIDEPILVLPCDNITTINFDFLYKSYVELGKPHCMVVPVLPVKHVEGDYVFGKNNVVSRLSRGDASTTYCSGIQVMNPKRINQAINQQEDFSGVWSSLIKKRRLMYSEVYPEAWYSINDSLQLSNYYKALDENTGYGYI